MSTPAASIVFPTRNRRDILLEAVAAALAQTVPVEVLVLDDGSTDGSAQAVAERFGDRVTYHSLAAGRGPAFQRNRGIELAKASIIFPLDDDSVMTSSRTVEQTLAEFNHPRIGAVGIPFINVRSHDQKVHQQAPDSEHIWVEHAFVGASHAIRKDVFLAVNGYREHLFYMGEEGDLTLRMLAKGWITRLGSADRIEHHESTNRVTARADFCGRRNDVLFVFHNVPAANVPIHLAGTLYNGVVTAVGSRHPLRQGMGLATGILQGLHQSLTGGRRPLSREIYRLHRSLKKNGMRTLEEIEMKLPPLPLAPVR